MRATSTSMNWRRRLLPLALAAIPLLLALPSTPISQAEVAAAGDAAGSQQAVIVRVEEDWKLVLNEPGEEVTAPQFHTVVSPYAHTDEAYAQISWNYRELPEFESGGVQLQAWGADYEFGYKSYRASPLSLNAETITWTQALETNGQRMRLTILNGQSTSWGTFGGEDAHIDIPYPVRCLSGYSSAVSCENSWITYGANRVSVLMITQVRYYAADGSVSVDNTPVVVYRLEQSH